MMRLKQLLSIVITLMIVGCSTTKPDWSRPETSASLQKLPIAMIFEVEFDEAPDNILNLSLSFSRKTVRSDMDILGSVPPLIIPYPTFKLTDADGWMRIVGDKITDNRYRFLIPMRRMGWEANNVFTLSFSQNGVSDRITFWYSKDKSCGLSYPIYSPQFDFGMKVTVIPQEVKTICLKPCNTATVYSNTSCASGTAWGH